MMVFDACSAARTSTPSRVAVVQLHRDEWPSLEKVRLDALDDAPTAFVTAAETERTQLPSYWEAQFDRARWVLVWDEGQIAGIAALARPDRDSPVSCRFVESVWVEPGHRGRGVLRQILEDLERCAVEDGASELRLWVLDTNESAAEAYRKLDFHMLDQAQDTTKLGPDGTFVKERLMSKRLL